MDGDNELNFFKNKSTVIVKNKMRRLKVKTIGDGIETEHWIDDSSVIRNIVIKICNEKGIDQAEEYSFCQDTQAGAGVKRNTSFGNFTEKIGQIANKEYNEYKQKEHMESKIQWFDHNKTLREQQELLVNDKGQIAKTMFQGLVDMVGISANMGIVTLRRKYFFADGDLNRKNPSQVDTIYNQCMNSIRKEEYPVTKKEAVFLAGTQSCILYGYKNTSTSLDQNILDYKQMLPKTYLGNKAVEADVLSSWDETRY